jgi:hypothetical protein
MRSTGRAAGPAPGCGSRRASGRSTGCSPAGGRTCPRRGVPLLARRVKVRPQPPVDNRLERLQPGDCRCGTLRRPGSARVSPSRTSRRCTPYLAASARTDKPPCHESRRISSNKLDLGGRHRAPSGCTHPDHPTSSSQVGPLQADTTIPPATTTARWGQIKPSWWGQSEPS